MCGLAAIFSIDGKISGEALERATLRLSHRGPDKRRQWISPDGRVGLGHTRLSIIDLETGDQPIANEDEQAWIIVNGEFYEFEKTQRELQQRGHRLRTGSDSEIALHLYEEYGPQCLERLRGEYAFILWDEREKRLLAARDRFGIKPLFYTFVDSTLYLASEVKALFAAGVSAQWDRESLFQHLFACMDQDRTLFSGVYQVPPGHYLLADFNGVRRFRYWDLDYPRSDEKLSVGNENEQISQLRHAIDEAVRIRMRADVPVGCLLSGGLDSSAVLGFAAKQSARPIDAFTVKFDHPVYDESPIARDTAFYNGANFNPVPLSNADFADHFSDAVWWGEMIAYNAHGVAKYLLSRAVHQAGYKVVLSGEGADELFAGYLFAQQDLAQRRNGGQMSSSAQGVQKVRRNASRPLGHLGTTISLKYVEKKLGFVSSLLKELVDHRSIFNTLLLSDFLKEYRDRNPYEELVSRLDAAGQLAGREPVIQSMCIWSKSIFPTYVLAAERLDMANAVEARLPFLDHRLFETARSMPLSLLIRGMKGKYVLREAARPFLTDTVYRRNKHPFTAPPFTVTTDNRLYQMMQDILSGHAISNAPFFDKKSVSNLINSIPQMDEASRIDVDPILVMIATTCILNERYRLH